jgi:hypothetical protein
MIVPNAELVDDTASPEVDLNSKITPWYWYCSKFAAIWFNQGWHADIPGFKTNDYDKNVVPDALEIKSPKYSLFLILKPSCEECINGT